MPKSWWIALSALAAFGASLFSGFHFDDYGMLQDPAVLSLTGWTRWQTRPLTWLSFWLNYQISGRNPMLWHAVNLALHIACALMLYRVLEYALPKAAFWGALLFAVHPVQSEPVDYIYARAIVLCTFFCLLAVNTWLRNRPWLAVAWFTLAVLSKEECLMLPAVLALFRFRKQIIAMFGVALMAGIHVLAAIQATGTKDIGANAGITPIGYLSEQAIAIFRYLRLLVLPWFFSIDPEIPHPTLVWRGLTWIALLALAIWAGRNARRIPAAFCFLAGLILLIPSSSIFPAADLAADRRMYLPMIAFAPALALLIPARHVLIAVALAAISIYRTYIWSSDERLWSEAAAQAPDKVRPILQLSRDVPPAEAADLLAKAAAMDPNNPDIPTELARVDLQLDRLPEALSQAGRALALAPHDPHALNNRGAVLLALHQTEAARADFLAALRIDPCLAEARENLARSGGIPPTAPPCPR